MTIWMPCLSGHSLPAARGLGPVAPAGGRGSEPGIRMAGWRSGSQVTKAETGPSLRPTPLEVWAGMRQRRQARIFLGRWGSCGVCLH